MAGTNSFRNEHPYCSMSQFINSSVYSLIREEYSGKTLSDAFLRLVLITIRNSGFRSFHIQEICEEFNNYIGFYIPYCNHAADSGCICFLYL